MVDHDPEDRQADGRWEGTVIQKKAPVREIRWKGLSACTQTAPTSE